MQVKEWCDARSRVEEEIQRRIEHKDKGSKFAEARAYVRQSWKSKKFNPADNPLLQDSSSTSSDEEEELHNT